MTRDGASPARNSILLRNNVALRGRGEQHMVFAHGFGCDQNMWRLVAPAFEEQYRTVLFDYVGSGRSDMSAFDPHRHGSLDGYVQDLLEVCGALGLARAVFVGHSVSAVVGLLAAIRAPSHFDRLVMIGPSPRYINEAPDYVGGFERPDIEGLLEMMDHNYLGWAHQLSPVVMGNPERPELSAELERSFCSTDPVAARLFARATFFSDNRADLPKVPIPSLILQVRDDAIAPLHVGRYMHERMPLSTLRILEASGHCPHMSHPELTIAAMRSYLRAPGTR